MRNRSVRSVRWGRWATSRAWSDTGMSLIELVVAMGLLLLLVSTLFSTFRPADGMFTTQTEAADMQQRFRAGADALRRDLSAAGAGGSVRPDATSLASLGPSVLPGRRFDSASVVRPDVITVLQALPLPAVATSLAQPLLAASGVTRVTVGPGCPALDAQCGIAVDDTVLVADEVGAVDLFTVTAVTPPAIELRHLTEDSGKVYPTGSVVARVSASTYSVRAATASRPPQLVRSDGAGPDAPVVDHVVGLSFEYLGDPAPPEMRRPLSDAGPWTTYGPKPPAADATAAPYTAGSNCLFEGNGTPLATPRLPFLGAAGSALVPLGAATLGDGPWCPDDASPNRYDADLLRIRAVVVTLRVESALDALRGPASALFARSGTARAGDRFLPDLVLRTRITPLNLAAGR